MKTLALLSLTLLLAACTGSQEEKGKVLHLALGDSIKSLDPALCYDTVSNSVMPLAMESLF